MAYIEHLQKCYNQLRRSRLVKQSPVVNDDSLQHFERILNSALPHIGNVEEELVDRTVKTMYFWNQRGYIRSLHPARSNKNMRKDARCFVLLTIGLEIVREFDLERVIRLNWNKDTHAYEAVSLIDPANPPDPETFRAEQREARNERNNRRRKPADAEGEATPEVAEPEVPAAESSGAWADQ
jgi:hypothetical protein